MSVTALSHTSRSFACKRIARAYEQLACRFFELFGGRLLRLPHNPNFIAGLDNTTKMDFETMGRYTGGEKVALLMTINVE